MPDRECEFASELDSYALGALAPERLATFRTHLESCATCTANLAEWEFLEAALDAQGRALRASVTPTAAAWQALSRALDDAPAQRLRPAPRRRMWVAVGAVAATILAAVLIVGDRAAQAPHARDAHARWILPDGKEVWLIAGQPFDVMPPGLLWTTTELEGRLGAVTLAVAGDTRLRFAERGPPAHLTLESGGVGILSTGDAVAVRVGELEVNVAPGGALRVVATDEADGRLRLTIDVGAGAAQLLGSTRAGVLLPELALPRALASGDRLVLDLPPALASTDAPIATPGSTPDGAGDPSASPGSTPSATPGEPGDPVAVDEPSMPPTPDTTPTPEPTPPTPTPVITPIAAGVVEIAPPAEPVAVGETFTIDVWIHTGDTGLASYMLELDLDAGEAELEIVGAPQSVPDRSGATSPLAYDFDAARGVLRVIDSSSTIDPRSGSLAPLGRGAFRLLAVTARVRSAPPGIYAIGCELGQLLAPDTSSLGAMRLQLRNYLVVR